MFSNTSGRRGTRRFWVLALIVGAFIGMGRDAATTARGFARQWVTAVADGFDVPARAASLAVVPLEGATPGDPPAVPTPAPDRVWRLRLRAFPDTVGKGAYRCSGCDGVFSSGDAVGATHGALEPLMVVVVDPQDDRNVYWAGRLKRSGAAQADVSNQVLLTQPPPYELRLIDTSPRGFTLCPNSASSLVLEQSDFDAAAGGAPDSGRSLSQEWFFWSCRIERP